MPPITTPPAITPSAAAQPVVMPPTIPAGPVRPAVPSTYRGRTAPAATPFRLVRLRVSEPLDGIAEVVAVLSHAGTSLAMALRLERRGSDWICTVVQVI